MKRKTLRAVLGGATVTLALAVGALALGGVTTDERTVYQTNGPAYTSVEELTREAHAVVRARVVGTGRTYTLQPDPPQLVVDPPPAHVPAAKAAAIAAAPSPESERAFRPAAGRLLKTDTEVEVLEVLRGTGIAPGQRLPVAQSGGVDRDGKTIEVEGNPLLQAGAEEVLFLKHDLITGKYFTVGGSQGRLKLAGQNRIAAVDPEEPVSRANHGKAFSALRAEVQAVR